MILSTFLKQPNELKDYDIDYKPWLTPMEDTIMDFEVSVECLTDPSDTSLEITQTHNSFDMCKLWVQGGTPTYQYKITIRLSTMGGRIDESELIFAIEEF